MRGNTIKPSKRALQALLDGERFIRPWGFQVESLKNGSCTIRLPFRRTLERPGGIVNGPALMAAADCAMWLAIKAHLGMDRDALTSELNTTFLSPAIRDCAPGLGELLTVEILAMAGGGDRVEGYGKAASVGTSGEIEHASALIHTLSFGNHYRTAVGAQSYLSFTNTRIAPGAEIQIPLMDKHDVGRRSHYLTVQFAIADAPGPDEIVVALGASIGGRPHHRIGDRYQDLKELGHGVDKPAG